MSAMHAGSSAYMGEIKNAHEILNLGINENKILKGSFKNSL
jgi:hypothetical protein